MPQPASQKEKGPVRLTVYSNGKALGDQNGVYSLEVVRSVGRIPRARFEVADGDMATGKFELSNGESLKPGAGIRIAAGYGGEEKDIFSGVVVGHGVKICGDNFSRLVVECRDKAVAMTIGRKSANYLDSTDSDIMTSLIKGHGLQAEVSATPELHKELVQYYCTDWDFLIARAEVNGYLVTIENAKVSVAAPRTEGQAVLKVSYGESLIFLDAGVDAISQLSGVTASSWNPKTQAAIEATAGPQALNQPGNLEANELARVVGPASYRLQSAAALEQTVLSTWAKACQAKAGLARVRGRMKILGSAAVKPGVLVELAKVGDRFNGKVFVSSVRHAFTNQGWISEVDFGLSPDWFAERRDLVAPTAAGMLPGVEGLQIGVVKKLDQDPDGQHKIQVSVPLMKAEKDGVWARLAGYYASNSFGAFFVPELGDEVVLGYLNNDPCHPVILGSLYSSKLSPPYAVSAQNHKKALVTRSRLKLEFDDEKQVVTIVTPGNNTVVISDAGKSILLQDQNGNVVQLSPEGVLLDSPKDIRVCAKGKISLDAVGKISLSSRADVEVAGVNVNHTAQGEFVASGSVSAKLSASGETTVKGALVRIN